MFSDSGRERVVFAIPWATETSHCCWSSYLGIPPNIVARYTHIILVTSCKSLKFYFANNCEYFDKILSVTDDEDKDSRGQIVNK